MDKSYWLFHFRLAGEKENNSRNNAHGLGHAYRCLTIIEQLESSYNISSIVVINKTLEGKKFITSKGIESFFEDDLETVLKENPVEIIVSDINYLEEKFIETYEKFSSWVSLAPRGQTKYRSSISFKDALFNDVEPILRSNNNKIFSGVDYVVTRPEFEVTKRNLLDKGNKKNLYKILISMGGIDHLDLTSNLIHLLSDLGPSYEIEVIIGPLYSNQENLKNQVSNYDSNITIIRSPENIYLNLAQSDLGIFAAGLISYESIGLGVPCLNINLSDFHASRSKELEDLGVGVDLGSILSLSRLQIKTEISKLVNDKKRLKSMRHKGQTLVDGRGAARIIKEIRKYLVSTI